MHPSSPALQLLIGFTERHKSSFASLLEMLNYGRMPISHSNFILPMLLRKNSTGILCARDRPNIAFIIPRSGSVRQQGSKKFMFFDAGWVSLDAFDFAWRVTTYDAFDSGLVFGRFSSLALAGRSILDALDASTDLL